MSGPLDQFAALKAENQRTLIDFLRVDLDLAFTLLETAKIEADSNPARCEAVLGKVRVALESTRLFQKRIDDPDESGKINDRADELEAALAAFRAKDSGTPI